MRYSRASGFGGNSRVAPSGRSLALAIGMVAVACGGPLLAQAPPPAAPAPAPAAADAPVPFGDWIQRCVPNASEPSKPRICEISQTVQLQGQGTILAQIAVGRVDQQAPYRLTLLLPPNVSFPSAVQIALDEKATTKIDVPWARCISGACIAELVPTPQMLQQLRGIRVQPRIIYPTASGQQTAVPFSLNGFGAALDALAKARN